MSQPTFTIQRVLLSQHPPFKVARKVSAWEGIGDWPCRWITLKDEPTGPWVAAFKCEFTLDDSLTTSIHVTADERYELFIDGTRVARGPERGDKSNWFYESFDLNLTTGRHVIVARLSVMAKYKPWAQTSVRTGFMLCPENPVAIEFFGTGVASWLGKQLSGYEFLNAGEQLQTNFGGGAAFRIDAATYDWGFEQGKGANWSETRLLHEGNNGFWLYVNAPIPFMKPATLPPMLDQTVSAIPAVRQSNHTPIAEAIAAGRSITIPSQTEFHVLLDWRDYYCVYPQIRTTGGTGSRIQLGFTEALKGPDENGQLARKHRDDVEGMTFVGIRDEFLPAGPSRLFEPLWWRCGRYIELKITTADEPLTIDALSFTETRYPLQATATFTSDDQLLNRYMPISLRTLQMCMHETYMDCPYFEQLMYVGDTRIQVLLTYLLTSDDRLPRKAIRMFDASRANPTGLTTSNFPAGAGQIIAPFSLCWIGMIYDYAMYRDDEAFVRELLPGARAVLDVFLKHLTPNGLLQSFDGWNYVDAAWGGGIPPGGSKGEFSGPINWQLLLALDALSKLETYAGEPELASRYNRLAQKLFTAIHHHFWDSPRQLFADDLERKDFSQHSQILAILSERLDTPTRQAIVGTNVLFGQPDVVTTNLYFSHFLFDAAWHTQSPQAFAERLQTWSELLNRGHVTFPEHNHINTRSDCHAWSASPLIHAYTTILGIRPVAFGFSQVLIKPMIGSLRSASGTIPHPRGQIQVSLTQGNGKITAEIVLPEGVTGTAILGTESYPLKGGHQKYSGKIP